MSNYFSLSWIKLITRPRDGNGCSSAPSLKSQPRICRWGTILIHHVEGSFRRWQLSIRAPLCAAVSANRTTPYLACSCAVTLSVHLKKWNNNRNKKKLARHVLDKIPEGRQRHQYKCSQQYVPARACCAIGLFLLELEIPVDGMFMLERHWSIAPGKQQGLESLGARPEREACLWEYSPILNGDVLSLLWL